MKNRKKQAMDQVPVSYTHLDVYKRQAPNQEQYEVAMQDLKQALAALEVE